MSIQLRTFFTQTGAKLRPVKTMAWRWAWIRLRGCGEVILPNIEFLSPFQPLYMKQNPSTWLYCKCQRMLPITVIFHTFAQNFLLPLCIWTASLEGCCSRYYWWNNECIKAGGGSVPTQSPKSGGSMPTQAPENWCTYMFLKITPSICRISNLFCPNTCSPHADTNYQSGSCVKNCEGPSPCAGLAKSWDTIYTTKKECCQQRLWWLGKECEKNWVTLTVVFRV
jgi:hypothetical protein